MASFTELPAPEGSRFHTVRHVVETGSTNADLLDQARSGADEGVVLVTDHQTAGRGRQQRVWHDDPGNALLVSVLLRPSAEVIGLVPLITGLAAVAALEAMTAGGRSAAAVGLKWPNDVLAPTLGERKLAGILAESVVGGPGETAVVTGMGMNLRWSVPPPDEVAVRAATVSELVGRPVERDEVLDRYLRGLEAVLRAAEAGGAAAVLDAYRPVCLTLGRRVRFTTSAGEQIGEAIDLTADGLLVLRTDVGARVELVSGDAHHVPLDAS